jgi:hypothetical protein
MVWLMAKLQTSVRMSPEARRLLGLISAKLGVSQGVVLELAIRKMAKSEKVA